MRTRAEIERKLKSILNIPSEERIYSLIVDKEGDNVYYRIATYRPKEGIRRYRIKRKDEGKVLQLWREFEELRRKEREALEKLRENPHLLKVILT